MAFMDLIHSSPVKGEGLDALDWKPAKSQGFEVRGYYLSLYLTTARLTFGSWCSDRRFLLG